MPEMIVEFINLCKIPVNRDIGGQFLVIWQAYFKKSALLNLHLQLYNVLYTPVSTLKYSKTLMCSFVHWVKKRIVLDTPRLNMIAYSSS